MNSSAYIRPREDEFITDSHAYLLMRDESHTAEFFSTKISTAFTEAVQLTHGIPT